MKRLLLILLCLLMLMCAACGAEDAGNRQTPTTTGTENTITAYYAHDPVIDRFFVDFLKKYPRSTLDPQTILRGKDISEYTAVIGQCNVTVRNVSTSVELGNATSTMYLLRVSIEGGTTIADRDRMMSTFSKIVRAIDPGCTKEQADDAILYLEGQKETLSGYAFRSNIKIEQYIPIVEKYGVPCRIDLIAYNYAPLNK